jgi:hypothetical protein
MSVGWKKIFGSPDPFQIAWVKNLLEQHGISAVVLDKRDSAFTIGETELYIQSEREEEAKSIIQKNSHEKPDYTQ